MKKDPTQFRQRFQRWKNGEQVYDAGLPKYEEGKESKDPIAYDTYMPEVVVTPNQPLHFSGHTYSEAWNQDLKDQYYSGQNVRNARSAAVPYLMEALTLPWTLEGAIAAPGMMKSIGHALRHPMQTAKAVYDWVDRYGISKDLILSQPENTLTRYVGTGDSGYKDALTSGIIRGNPNPPRFSAAELRKLRNKFGKVLTEEDFRALASNNIASKEQFDRINSVLKAGSSSKPKTPGKINLMSKDYSLGESFEEYQKWLETNRHARRLENYATNVLSKHKPEDVWAINWKDNPMATFATENEILGNGLQFPGDYAVQIRNANKYAKNATSFGHFAEHPVTEFPMPYNHKDVSWFKRKDGLLSRKKYMIRVPEDQLLSDFLKYNQK